MNNAGSMGLVPWNAVLGEDRMMRRSARELLLRKATYDVCETFAADVHIDFQTILFSGLQKKNGRCKRR